MATPSWAARVAEATTETNPRQVGAIPIVYPLIEMLRIRETINELRWSNADIDIGRVVEVLVLNRLLSPQPLSHIGEWASQTVVVPMLGLREEQLYDQRFGRALDEIHPWLGEAWVRVATNAVQQGKVDVSVSHWDTTSIDMEGIYEDSDWAKPGRSSDGRLDNVQVKLGMGVASQGRVPFLYRLLSGGTEDTTTPVPHMKSLAAFLRQPECVVPATYPLSTCVKITSAFWETSEREM